jgi:hypothetical protein
MQVAFFFSVHNCCPSSHKGAGQEVAVVPTLFDLSDFRPENKAKEQFRIYVR